VNLEVWSTLITCANHQGISEAITDHVMTLIAHRITISVCLMCSGQIIFKPRISGHCHHNQFSMYYCLNTYMILWDKPSLWLFLTISTFLGMSLETSRPNLNIVAFWYLVRWSQPGTFTLISIHASSWTGVLQLTS
jgi:hypothetical protein